MPYRQRVKPETAALRRALDKFAALLGNEDSSEREWQQLFEESPFILSDSLPLRLRPSQIVARGRPGRSEADFVFYPDEDPSVPTHFGVIELKRPSTSILTSPRRQVLRLSGDASTAYAQAQLYANELAREVHQLPERLIAVGGGAHIFLIVGSSIEIERKVVTDLERRQFHDLLPPGAQLLPYDTLFRLFAKRIPPAIHVVVPAPLHDRSGVEGVDFRRLAPVFLSYTRDDYAFVTQLSRSLGAVGVPVWDYQTNLLPSDDAAPRIKTAIEEASVVILILSRSSLGREAVTLELAQAYARQSRLGRDVILPVILDVAWLRPGRFEILRDYPSIDFTRWQDDKAFQEAFPKVLAALKTVAA